MTIDPHDIAVRKSKGEYVSPEEEIEYQEGIIQAKNQVIHAMDNERVAARQEAAMFRQKLVWFTKMLPAMKAVNKENYTFDRIKEWQDKAQEALDALPIDCQIWHQKIIDDAIKGGRDLERRVADKELKKLNTAYSGAINTGIERSTEILELEREVRKLKEERERTGQAILLNATSNQDFTRGYREEAKHRGDTYVVAKLALDDVVGHYKCTDGDQSKEMESIAAKALKEIETLEEKHHEQNTEEA